AADGEDRGAADGARRGEGRLMSPNNPVSSPAKAGDPVFQRHLRLNREAAAYWIARSSRAMTGAIEDAVRPTKLPHPPSCFFTPSASRNSGSLLSDGYSALFVTCGKLSFFQNDAGANANLATSRRPKSIS